MKGELTYKRWIRDRFDDFFAKYNRIFGNSKLTAATIDITVYLFVLLYVYTAYEKLKYHQKFENTLSHSELIGAYAWFVSWAVPIMEIVVSLLLILPWQAIRKIALWSAMSMIGLFSLYIIYMLLFVPPENRTCECGGVVSSMVWSVHLLFNGFYLVLGIDAIRLTKSNSML